MSVVPLLGRCFPVSEPGEASPPSPVRDAAAVDHLRIVVDGRVSGEVTVSVAALNIVLAVAGKATCP